MIRSVYLMLIASTLSLVVACKRTDRSGEANSSKADPNREISAEDTVEYVSSAVKAFPSLLVEPVIISQDECEDRHDSNIFQKVENRTNNGVFLFRAHRRELRIGQLDAAIIAKAGWLANPTAWATALKTPVKDEGEISALSSSERSRYLVQLGRRMSLLSASGRAWQYANDSNEVILTVQASGDFSGMLWEVKGNRIFSIGGTGQNMKDQEVIEIVCFLGSLK
jgi:hypothetical protein